jgi:hypothetical protein
MYVLARRCQRCSFSTSTRSRNSAGCAPSPTPAAVRARIAAPRFRMPVPLPRGIRGYEYRRRGDPPGGAHRARCSQKARLRGGSASGGQPQLNPRGLGEPSGSYLHPAVAFRGRWPTESSHRYDALGKTREKRGRRARRQSGDPWGNRPTHRADRDCRPSHEKVAASSDSSPLVPPLPVLQPAEASEAPLVILRVKGEDSSDRTQITVRADPDPWSPSRTDARAPRGTTVGSNHSLPPGSNRAMALPGSP